MALPHHAFASGSVPLSVRVSPLGDIITLHRLVSLMSHESIHVSYEIIFFSSVKLLSMGMSKWGANNVELD